jgi:GH25 family lysozyme M1 (1,4-beta-N-acetylmuramidase)
MKGIDVSKHQGLIDWKKVKESGVEFAIIRAGYGKSTVDEYFIENIVGAHTAGIKVGVYWFIYALNDADALKNAEMFHKTIEPYRNAITMKVFADYEYDSDNYAIRNDVTPTKDSRTRIVKMFLYYLEERGWDVGNYANPDYINNKFLDLSEYPLWLAWYTDNENDTKKYNPIMWQYSSKGSVPGISGNVDMNICYEEIKKEQTEVVNDKKIVVHAYSKEKEGNTKLSANFKVKEFACKDGSDVVFVAPELVELLQKIRNHFGKAVVINSGYRTPTYNKKVGGASYSQHLYGTATDIRINGVNPKDIAKYVETLIPNTGGIGIYSNFVHVDVRRNKSRWNG